MSNKVTIYADANYQGASKELGEGSYDVNSLGIGNDKLSSLKVPAGMKVTLYENAGFSGRSKTFTQDASYVGNDFNDITSSLKVETVNQQTDRVQEILAAHNKYRAEVGVAPLQWSNTLANSAQQWANHLAATGQFQHSGSGYGENIWMGTSGHYSFTQMVDGWGGEKKYFIPNSTFPNVSNSGKWQDVGHYTQLIWRNTQEVGCGFASGGGNDYLVCQYNPAGNVIGQKVY